MLAFGLMAVIIAVPFVLKLLGMDQLAVFFGFIVVLSLPSMIYAVYKAIKTRTLPTIINGPGFFWSGTQRLSPKDKFDLGIYQEIVRKKSDKKYKI